MLVFVGTILAITGSVGKVFGACTVPPPTPRMHAIAGSAFRDELQALRPASVRPRIAARLTRAASTDCLTSFVEIDLGDGRRSLLARDCHPGANNVIVYVFHAEHGGYRLILTTLTDGFNRRPERSHGLNRLLFRGHGSAIEWGVTLFDYDGVAYKPINRPLP